MWPIMKGNLDMVEKQVWKGDWHSARTKNDVQFGFHIRFF